MSIAAGNVANFVDIESGGYGTVIQDATNSAQTPSLANFATLANVMAGCIMRVTANACVSFFRAATGPGGKEPGEFHFCSASRTTRLPPLTAKSI